MTHLFHVVNVTANKRENGLNKQKHTTPFQVLYVAAEKMTDVLRPRLCTW